VIGADNVASRRMNIRFDLFFAHCVGLGPYVIFAETQGYYGHLKY
jgi:hypothetical protein